MVPAIAGLLCILLPAGHPLLAQEDEAPRLLVSLDEEGRLLPLSIRETPFEAVLDNGDGVELTQHWQYNIYAQFYFPGEDPGIDFTFLGNRRYPRLQHDMEQGASLIWVNTAATRGDAEKLRNELARQGLEGAFIARVRGEFHHSHTDAEKRLLDELAGRLVLPEDATLPAREWLAAWDRQRRFAMQARLLFVDGVSGVNEALALHDKLEAELGHCGMLNRPAGDYRLFCGAYDSREKLKDAYDRVAATSGMKPVVVCIWTNGNRAHWTREDPDRW